MYMVWESTETLEINRYSKIHSELDNFVTLKPKITKPLG